MLRIAYYVFINQNNVNDKICLLEHFWRITSQLGILYTWNIEISHEMYLLIHIGKWSLELDSYLINYWQFVNKTWIYHRSLKGQTKTHLYFHIYIYIIIYTIKIFWSTSIKRDLQWNQHILTRNIYIMILKKISRCWFANISDIYSNPHLLLSFNCLLLP